MISILFCSRVKDNPDSNIARLLDSTVATTTAEERGRIEYLVKYDADDDARPPESLFQAYPFPVRTFQWSRGEGRHYLHHAQEYLFTQRDLRARFILMMSDDFWFTRPGWVSEILAIRDEFCIIGRNRPPIEAFAGIYEQEPAIRQWNLTFGAMAPVLSTRFVEVCQNFGWQSNVDSWVMGLSIVLYDLYGLVIWKTLPEFYERGGGWGTGDTPTYNNMELTGLKGPYNKYWFELLRRQARNLYLNMVHGTDVHGMRFSPKWMWHKVRSQPLRRLPLRVARRVLKEVGVPLA